MANTCCSYVIAFVYSKGSEDDLKQGNHKVCRPKATSGIHLSNPLPFGYNRVSQYDNWYNISYIEIMNKICTFFLLSFAANDVTAY